MEPIHDGPMAGRTVLVTGGTGGIGGATARVLVNNVGGYWNTRHETVDGLERTFALNHLAPFLLTNLLLERMKQSAPARVVTVASNVQALGRIDFDDLQNQRSYSGARAWSLLRQ